jgi:hypothetical protein
VRRRRVQGDFDGVIEAYRHALDGVRESMIEVATGGQKASSAV